MPELILTIFCSHIQATSLTGALGRTSIQIEYINTDDQLAPFLDLIRDDEIFYFDMEMDNMFHYESSITLIQVYKNETGYLIDLVSDINIQPLLDLIKDKLLVLHGADFDLRMLFQKYGFIPSRIYDTMLAARLLGDEQFGLAALVKKYFGDILEKKFQKADWSKRPLTQEMMEYAAGDTVYLPGLYENLNKELSDLGRTEWHEEMCEELIGSTSAEKEIDEDRIWRIKNAKILSPLGLNILREIWHWRENTAKKLNRPPFKVTSHDNLLSLASFYSKKENQNKKMPQDIRIHHRFKPEIMESIHRALDMPEAEWPKKLPRRSGPWEPVDTDKVDALKTIRDQVAETLNLPGSLIASKQVLTQVANLPEINRTSLESLGSFSNWQKNLLWEKWLDSGKFS